MSETASPRFALPYLHPAQAQKEAFHNEALSLIDTIVHACVESVTLSVPPASPVVGQAWLVASAPSGAWAGHEGHLAAWTAGGWRFVAPVPGMRVEARASGHGWVWRGTQWTPDAVRDDALHLGGVAVVGVQQGAIASPAGGGTIDVECRAALGAVLTALRAHGLISA